MSKDVLWSINLNPVRLSPRLDPEEMEQALERAIIHLRYLGVQMVRMDLLWRWLEPEPGEINQAAVTTYTRMFERLALEGISVFAVLYSPPDWAKFLLRQDPDAFLECWRGFCRLIRREFVGQIDLYQIWNEPNNYFSSTKGDFNLFKTLKMGSFELAYGVHWDLLGGLFRIAREELEPGSFLVYNLLANLSNFVPFSFPFWVDWDEFTERMLMEAGDCIDAIAIDHYPDTWTPQCSPLEWAPLEAIVQKVNDPRSPWYRKTVLIGETGYSSCNNVSFGFPLGTLFQDDHTEEAMVEWYASSLPYLAKQFRSARLPHNKINIINLYELYDVPSDPDDNSILKLEQHFGLMKHNYEPKLVFPLISRIVKGQFDYAPTASGRLVPPYIQTAKGSKWMHRALWQRLLSMAQVIHR